MNAVTQQVEQQQEWIPEIERSDAGNRLPVNQQFVKDIGVSGSEWRVLVDQIFPAAKSVQAIAMALTYCKVRNLDIFKKPVHIVPMWSSALGRMVETVWPGIAEIRTTATRTGEYAGIDAVEFGPMIDRTFTGTLDQWVEPEGGGRKVKQSTKVDKLVRFPEWASVVIYRMVAGERCAYHAKVYWEETYATVGKSDIPNDMWAKRPRGQLDKCVEAAALRKAFPEELGNTYAAEEMEGRTIDGVAEHVATPTPPAPPKPPAPPSAQSDVTDAEVVDAETGEIIDDAEIVRETGETTAEFVPDGDFDPSAFFNELETALAGAMDEATIEEVWSNLDPEGRFDGDDISRAIADKIKVRRLAQIHPMNAG